jgi:DNA-binding helix-hairpin-helix protein with protein kinase domain
VYRALDGKHVVKLFKSPTPQLAKAMELILGPYNCVANQSYWQEMFCWPNGLVLYPDLGIRMPVIPATYRALCWFVFPKLVNRLPRTQKSWHTRMLFALRLARAVGRLHKTGLAHSDLSPNNIYVDPDSGRIIIIDLDGLVVRDFVPAQVVGTPEYIAPEVLEGQGLPNPKTDLHALAVLVHQLLLYRHPLRGPKTFSAVAEDDERLLLGRGGIYVDHPQDKSNRPSESFWPSGLLGETLATLFRRALVDGLRAPDVRPSASQWEEAIAHLSDRVVRCLNPRCDEQFFPISDGVKELRCLWCATPFPRGVPVLRFYRGDAWGSFRPEPDWFVAALPKRTLHRWHAETGVSPGPGVDPGPVAMLEQEGTSWYLRNQGLVGLRVLESGAAKGQVPIGDRVLLSDGATLLLAAPPRGRAVVVQRSA